MSSLLAIQFPPKTPKTESWFSQKLIKAPYNGDMTSAGSKFNATHNTEDVPPCESTPVNDVATMADWFDICRWEDEGGAIGRSAADGD